MRYLLSSLNVLIIFYLSFIYLAAFKIFLSGFEQFDFDVLCSSFLCFLCVVLVAWLSFKDLLAHSLYKIWEVFVHYFK